jgi:hypothetical protein
MSKRTTDKVVSWRVIRLRGSPALWVGDVDAPDEPSESNEVVWLVVLSQKISVDSC